jgi:GT2 family glycosyltransferase
MAIKVEIISASRRSQPDFQASSALGVSLRRLGEMNPIVARVAASNTQSLPLIYNQGLRAADNDSIVVFMHDDVWIDDYYLVQRLGEAMKAYDVIGVAGNRRRVPRQPAWAFIDLAFTWDWDHLSGSISHGPSPFGAISSFGEAPAECELLDGVFLAAKKAVLLENELSFDPRFDFDFYDMDFCRAARQKGLKLGTWPICLTHQSQGEFGSQRWRRAYRSYLEKWGD